MSTDGMDIWTLLYGDRELLEAVVAARIKAEEAASAESAEEPAAEEEKEPVGAAAE